MDFQPLSAASAEQVFDALARHVRPLETRQAAPTDALGHVLAADARSELDFPPFDRAMMDGYAVRCADFDADGHESAADAGRRRSGLQTATGAGRSDTAQPRDAGREAAQPRDGVTLRVRGLIRAGDANADRLDPGTCVQINTGAPLPAGADAVVIVEDSEPLDAQRVRLRDAPQPGQHIERRGGLARRGDLLLRAGTRVGPGGLAALVSGGPPSVRVFERPRIGVLTTGDEIVAGGGPRGDAQIFDSNGIMLAEYVRSAGGVVVPLGRSPDEADALRSRLEEGLSLDLLCVTGGMSKGSHDLVPAVLEQLGVRWLVTSLHLKPGKPTRIGRGPAGGWVIGLPGNPVSCAVCFLLFGRALLDGLSGLPIQPPMQLAGTLEASMPANGSRPLFQPGQWQADREGQVRVGPIAWHGSGDPFGMSVADALIFRPARCTAAQAGDRVRFVPLDVPR